MPYPGHLIRTSLEHLEHLEHLEQLDEASYFETPSNSITTTFTTTSSPTSSTTFSRCPSTLCRTLSPPTADKTSNSERHIESRVSRVSRVSHGVCERSGVASLLPGLMAVGGLFMASVADFWLLTCEDIDGIWVNPVNSSEIVEVAQKVCMHAGLWRFCTILPDGQPSICTSIGYFQTWERVEGGDTTNSIMRAIRKSSPLMVSSLLLLIIALGLSTVGNTKRDGKTLIGAVVYIMSALLLAVGVIFYISAVNDEVSHRKKPTNPEDPKFSYSYGWAFFFAGSSFVSSMMAAVSNITLYVRRFRVSDDIASIVPGLENKHSFEYSSTAPLNSQIEANSVYDQYEGLRQDEYDGPQGNPTIIL